MSSTYRFLCLSHSPAIVVEPWESQNRDEAVGLAERRDTAEQLAEHRDCRLAVGRYSYPLVEVYNPKSRRWADRDLLALLLAAYDADVGGVPLAPFHRQGWDVEFLSALRPHLREDT